MKKAASIMVLVVLAATLLSACSDSTTGSAAVSGTTTVLSLAGGEGTVGSGANGGAFYVYPFDNTSVKISRTGSVDTTVDTSFFDKVISTATFTTGAVPLDVTTNLTLNTYPTGTAGLTDGQFYMHAGTNSIYKYDAAGDTELVVTGIHVHPGVTLTLGLNLNGNITGPAAGNTGYDMVQVRLTNGIWNQGTITTMDLVTGKDDILNPGINTADGTSLDKGSMDIRIGSSNYPPNDGMVFLNDGVITTRGTDTTLTTGGFGGHISIWADTAVVNRGTIDSSGGNGMDGGRSGYSSLKGGFGLWNTGPVNAKGGTGTDGEGGLGYYISFDTGSKVDGTYVWQSLLYNSGTLNSSGGDGTGGGGHASGATLYAGFEGRYACGALVNSGSLIGNGGNATTAGYGGDGASYSAYGYHDLRAYGCNLLNSGAIEFKGGTGKGAGTSGGSGGELYVRTAMAYDNYNNVVAPGSIYFGGSVLADGGAGESGGSGGYVELGNYVYLGIYNWSWGDYIFATNSGSIEVLGYSTVNLKGGKGAIDGGIGGTAELFWDISNYNDTNVDENGNGFIVTPSSIYNDTDFDLAGGQGMAGNGGTGGTFYAEMSGDYLFWNWWKPGAKSTLPAPGSIENRGNISTRGGQGALQGGNAGSTYRDYAFFNVSIYLLASGNITNTGALDASGGLATAATGTGGIGNTVYFDALGNVLNSGTIAVSGGNGAAAGGAAGWAYFWSEAGTDINTAAITANGGNANASLGGSIGGAGGTITIYTYLGPMIATNTGTLSVAGGTGETPGGIGYSYVGWD